jgi:hypothetical protein
METNYVYFIQGTYTKNIKIGISASPNKRLKSLQTGASEPLVLLKQLKGTAEIETYFHQKFGHFNICGEWFRPEPDLMFFIENLTQSNITNLNQSKTSNSSTLSIKTISQKLTLHNGQLYAVKEGKTPGRVAYGYTRECGEITPDYNAAVKVLALFATFSKGFQDKDIPGRFTIEDLTQVFPKSYKAIHRILQNPTYTGKFVWGDDKNKQFGGEGQQVFYDHHVGIVPTMLYEEVQAIFFIPLRRYTRKGEKDYKITRLEYYFALYQDKAKEWFNQYPFDKFKIPPNDEVFEFFELV